MEITTRSPLPPLPAAVEVAAFRIVQEALTNVVRHACALHTRVSMELEPGAPPELAIEIADDGRGFSSAEKDHTRAGGGVGLTSMRERAEELGGRLQVESTLDTGTRIRAWLPLAHTP